MTIPLCDNCQHEVGHHDHRGCLYVGRFTGPCDCPFEGRDPKGGDVANPNRTTAREEQVGGNHYRQFKIQPWDVIDEYGLDFYRGNVVKYLLRAGHKGVKLEDLKKARHYLDRVIEIEEENR